MDYSKDINDFDEDFDYKFNLSSSFDLYKYDSGFVLCFYFVSDFSDGGDLKLVEYVDKGSEIVKKVRYNREFNDHFMSVFIPVSRGRWDIMIGENDLLNIYCNGEDLLLLDGLLVEELDYDYDLVDVYKSRLRDEKISSLEERVNELESVLD